MPNARLLNYHSLIYRSIVSLMATCITGIMATADKANGDQQNFVIISEKCFGRPCYPVGPGPTLILLYP